MTYDFECKKCGKIYEEIVQKYDESGKYPDVKCPSCGSVSKIKLITGCRYQFVNPVGTDRWNNSHDYRFKHMQPKVRKEREEAMKQSHMGNNPYNEIDDVSSGKYFGDVK